MRVQSLTILSIAKKYGRNFFANFVQQGLRFLVLYVAARQFGPVEFGMISLMFLLSNYLMNVNLGAVNGLKRQLPLIYTGNREPEGRTAFFSVFNFNVLLSALASAAVALMLYLEYAFPVKLCVLFIFLVLAINNYFCRRIYLTATGQWQKLFVLQLICALGLAVSFFSLLFDNYYVLLILMVLSYMIPDLFFAARMGFRPVIDREALRGMIRIGFPAMLSGLIYLVFQSTDRLLVSQYYSGEEFGYYSFAWLFAMSLNLVTNLSAEMLLQRGVTRYAQSGSKPDLIKYLFRYARLLQVVLTGITAALILLSYLLVPVYLAEYIPALPVIRNILIAFVIQQLAVSASCYYFIIGKQRIYNILLITVSVLNFLILGAQLYFPDAPPQLERLSGIYIFNSIAYVIALYLPIWKLFRSHETIKR